MSRLNSVRESGIKVTLFRDVDDSSYTAEIAVVLDHDGYAVLSEADGQTKADALSNALKDLHGKLDKVSAEAVKEALSILK
jgi:hypothetical protein